MIFLPKIHLAAGPLQDCSAAWIVQMALVAACSKELDVEHEGREHLEH